MDLKKELQKLNCLACGAAGPSDIHHVKTRGSGGKDDPWNMIPLSRDCHQLWHKIGPSKFLIMYPHVKEHLLALGWTYEGGRLRYANREITSE